MSSDEGWSIFPLTDNLSNSYVDPDKLVSFMSDEQKHPIGMKNFKSRFQSRSVKFINTLPIASQLPRNGANLNSVFQTSSSLNTTSMARMRWKSAAIKVKMLSDPWSEFRIESLPAENVIRHRYNAIKKQWIKDECTVKMEPQQFANGAMRACFRLKKLSNIVHKTSWEHASNYVAKSYISPDIPRERYFDDVKLQMDAKLWAEIYNRHNPPKKIDMFQVSILEFNERAGSPLFHLEHFIEGKYIKYNSNSGFVEDVHVRHTPQAFSHFTFESSNHELIVVDVQGVGDLYTDPQIHTAAGTEYGDGNLGIKGFALFFSSHVCNDVCRSLGLTQFDLAESEVKSHEKLVNSMQKFCLTQSRGLEEHVSGSPSSFGEYFRHRIRSRSDTSACSDENSNSNELPDIDESEGYESYESPSPLLSPNALTHRQNSTSPSSSNMSAPIQIGGHHHSFSTNPISIPTASPMQFSMQPQQGHSRSGRVRQESSCLDSAFSMDEAVNYFNSKPFNKPRPSCVHNYMLDQSHSDYEESDYSSIVNKSPFEEEESLLGKIHLELCKYHEIGRFLSNENEEFDVNAAFFHLKQAANLGVIDALVSIAKIHLQLPRDILPNYKVDETDNNLDIGFDYMMKSAERGEKNSIYFIAKALDTGAHLSKNRSIDWNKSLEFYQKILNISDDEPRGEDAGYSEVSTDCDPIYAILARMAEMNMQGGHGLEQDPSEAASLFNEAAEKATAFGKGRMANKYYMLAEQASAMADDY